MDKTDFQFFYFIYIRRLLDINCFYKNTACSILCTFYAFGDKKAQKDQTFHDFSYAGYFSLR